jgi:hypothetical protein
MLPEKKGVSLELKLGGTHNSREIAFKSILKSSFLLVVIRTV